jgi:hypothetical protein
MMLVAALLAFWGQEEKPRAPSAVESGLRYLARHQTEDGSWGAAPKGCACPRDDTPAVDEAGIRRFHRLIDELGLEEIDRRAAAEKDLLAMGRAVQPMLERAIGTKETEVRGRLEAVLDWIRLEPERGDIELTALAVLAILGDGYCRASRDEVDGIRFGAVLDKGLKWLQAKQEKTGAFDPRDPVAQALATVAVSESAWNLGADPASRGWKFLATASDLDRESLAWTAIACHSVNWSKAERNENPNEERLLGTIDSEWDAWKTVSAILRGWEFNPKPRGLCGSGVTPLTPCTNRLLVAALDAPRRADRRLLAQGRDGLKERALPGQCAEEKSCGRGSWEGEGLRRRLAATAHHALALEAYYRPYDR